MSAKRRIFFLNAAPDVRLGAPLREMNVPGRAAGYLQVHILNEHRSLLRARYD